MLLRSTAVVCLLTLPFAVQAAPQKVSIPVGKEGELDVLVRVIAPAARAAAVNDAGDWLAVAHHVKFKDAHVSLFRLDKTGQPSAPILLKLPRPEGFAKYDNYALAVTFHPTLPLLYVWQDAALPKKTNNDPLPITAEDQAAFKQFDHLLIYSLATDKPELLTNLCRGIDYGYSLPGAGLAVDLAGERLYIPNIRNLRAGTQTVVGSFVLDSEGLPVPGDGKQLPKGTRSERIIALNAARDAGKLTPQKIAPFNGDAFPDLPSGCGFGFVPVSRDKVFIGGYHTSGVLTWDPDNAKANLSSFHIVDYEYTESRLTAHPTLPLLFVTSARNSAVSRFEHVDGNLTLLPQRAILASAYVFSAPAVLGRSNRLAVGGRNKMHVLNLTEDGFFKGDRIDVAMGNQDIQALAYSAKHDRLYVPVEKPK